MTEFRVKILGSGSATPMVDRNHTAQVLSIGSARFLIDCGEGTQHRFLQYQIRPHKISHIFISHLHGDHFLGLPGFLSTMSNQGRIKEVHLVAPYGIRDLLSTWFRISGTILNYRLIIHELSHESGLLPVIETTGVEIFAFPLKHRIPTFGYVFREKPGDYHLIREKLPPGIGFSQIRSLKKGQDVLREDGTILYPASEFTLPPHPIRSYAYCSDTIFDTDIVEYIKGVNLLYHESTFLDEHVKRAGETWHSTAAQAATVAKMAEVGTLLIGHFSSRYKNLQPFIDQAQSVFPETVLGIEGFSVDVSQFKTVTEETTGLLS